MTTTLNDPTLEQYNLATNNYGYSATGLDNLGATEYTLVSMAVDVSGSVGGFKKDLEDVIKRTVQACKLSPRADNLMLRITSFDDKISELHGFKLLSNCNTGDYDNVLHVGGSTALYDASENAVTATTDYAQQLAKSDYTANGIAIFITDGGDNASTLTATYVKKALENAVLDENLESMVSILVGVNVNNQSVSKYLRNFKQDAGITQYIELENADSKTLAKLAEFVSKSISAQSASLGTGGASQSLTF